MRNHIPMTGSRGFLFILLSIFNFQFSICKAQTTWTASDIPDSLKKEAYSVVRDYQVTVTANSQKSLVTHYHMVVTILNKKGDNHAAWHFPTDKFTQLTSFSGKVYDDMGKVKEKMKRSDVHTSQYSEHLATDNLINYVEPPVMSYPYTMEYDWEVKANDGYVEYEYFSPIAHDRQALEKASFTLTIPSDTKIRYMGLPYEWNPDKQSSGKNDVYVWNFPAMRCFIEDEYDDHYMFLLPSVLAMPYEFCLADTKGTLDTWENMGKWYAQLAEGRGKLLPADVHKVRELTSDCKNDMEKIAALYKYLGEKTRYVSIQLGIGGWQPMTAEEVGKTGFGDCKALTNYMQALLKEAGIESCQTTISTIYSDLLKDFPNMHQTNHVILTIPQSDGSNMVVECTNPQLPLGFVPGGYAGHQAMQIVNGTGRFIRIADYTPENNYENLVAEVQLQADGKSSIKFSDDHYGDRYEDVRSMVYQDEKERRERVLHWIDLQDPSISDLKINETKTGATSHLEVKADMKVTYGKLNGNKMFITCNPFRVFHEPRFRNGRKRPIIVDNAYSLNDEMRITLPEGFSYTPGATTNALTTDFGSYSLEISQDGQQLIIKTKVSITKGRYDISRKEDFKSFREKVSRMLRKQIILTKNE